MLLLSAAHLHRDEDHTRIRIYLFELKKCVLRRPSPATTTMNKQENILGGGGHVTGSLRILEI